VSSVKRLSSDGRVEYYKQTTKRWKKSFWSIPDLVKNTVELSDCDIERLKLKLK
jgi:hypothetical protein